MANEDLTKAQVARLGKVGKQVSELKGLLSNVEQVLMSKEKIVYAGIAKPAKVVVPEELESAILTREKGSSKALRTRVRELIREKSRVETIYRLAAEIQSVMMDGMRFGAERGQAWAAPISQRELL